ncbi:non-oxidative hydroxyarylic acid decarboxylases subunit D [Amycolatopsis keratiniphila]|uniref:Phenolic acid decarboxylase subunit D n=1 Tax=Amycolatopsis keratiniphila subsp. keratiniphila TaxID=227715 RepID=A0A1W2M2W7_9PSEU|nr:non-oxidative hydroxyarylic acid decarboxylases subunit D [Amycolatopsis keratiniphila]ONF74384.1 hypothetical protein AVR91_0203605 [Amycolatopsis keratiniphila subsp. keratiniphila]
MTCPRCRSEETHQLATSPVPGVWEVWQCPTCLFCWRSTEPPSITNPDLYSERFRLSMSDIVEAGDFPPVPEVQAD